MLVDSLWSLLKECISHPCSILLRSLLAVTRREEHCREKRAPTLARSRWKMPQDVSFGPVHLCVGLKGTCEHTLASLIASESPRALFWGCVCCLGSGLSSSHSLLAAPGYAPRLGSPLSALTVINKDAHFLGFAPIFLKVLPASGEEAEIINHCWHVKGPGAASLGEAVMQFQAWREHGAAYRDKFCCQL